MSATVGEPSSASTRAAAAVGPAAISLQHLSKRFRLPQEPFHTLKQRALHPRRRRQFNVLQALDDVSLEVAQNEFFGIVGRNGSGKSTLLKCLAGIYDTDAGSIEIHGKLSPFIELGVGFNPELTARDNAIINAIMLGLSRRQAEARLADVLAFAELEEFVDLKLKNYSSGMQVRLAFAVAIGVDADILLIDEVLAVGDASFQQKCFDEFTRLKREGRTIVFVTHDMGAVQRFCDRAMLLERGRVVDVGEPSSIARQYTQLNFTRIRQEARKSQDASEVLLRDAEVISAVFESADGEVLVTADQGQSLCVRVEIGFHRTVEDPIFSVALLNGSDQLVFGTSTEVERLTSGRWGPGEIAVVRVPFENWLAPGRYQLLVSVARAGFGTDVLDMHNASSLLVLADKPAGGLAYLPHSFEIERA